MPPTSVALVCISAQQLLAYAAFQIYQYTIFVIQQQRLQPVSKFADTPFSLSPAQCCVQLKFAYKNLVI